MTNTMTNLCELTEKTPDADLPRETIEFAAERLCPGDVSQDQSITLSAPVSSAWRSAPAL
jgi:hypothetical protein